jgi:hypothetical protein
LGIPREVRMATTHEPPVTADDSLEARIRERAHELYLLRGEEPGSSLQDWLEAEREIIAEQRDELQE